MSACAVGDVEALCGTLSVPEDRSRPEGRHIELRVALVPARSARPAADPVFMLAGGPGAAATEAMAWTVKAFRGTHDARDIVLVDQRGTGGSHALWLGPAPDVRNLTERDADAALRRWLDAELEAIDGDPSFYTTSVAMDDLDAVREALGYSTINLYGASYGATAAQYYIRQHADRLRAVVLDGATLLDVPIFEHIAANSQRALDAILDRCEADAPCRTAYPDVAADLEAAWTVLETSAKTTGVVDPWDGKAVVVDAAGFATALHAALLSADRAVTVPWLIDQAAGGRWDAVARAMLAARGGEAPTASYPLMSGEIRCSEAWADFDPEDVARLGAGSYLLEPQLAAARQQERACRYAPEGIVPANDAAPARSDVPVLFLVGDADPQDPPANIADASTDFPNSRTVVAPGHGHTVGHLGCLPSVVDSFFESPDVETIDASCVSRDGVPLPSFQMP